jgi:cinnamoyl-CoA reductase
MCVRVVCASVDYPEYIYISSSCFTCRTIAGRLRFFIFVEHHSQSAIPLLRSIYQKSNHRQSTTAIMTTAKSTTRKTMTTKLLSLLLISSSACVALSTPKRASVITGANGYLGREIVHALLQDTSSANDDEVIACLVRSQRVTQEQSYWKSRAATNILVLPYDMLDGGASLTSALDSIGVCDSVCLYHVASVFGPTEDHEQTARDNVKGAEDAVTALGRFPAKCRLVLTSSMAAVRGTGQPPSNGECYTHLDWNTRSILGENWGSSYQWGKAESERRAWQLSMELGVQMTSLCPSFIFGPSLDGTFASSSYSIQLVKQWIQGDAEVQSRLCVDVRDVAKAHVAAGRLDSAVGQRFLVSAEARLSSKITAEALQKVSSTPDKITYDSKFDGGAMKIGSREVIATDRLKELGVELRSVYETFEDMGRALVRASIH